MLDYNRLLLFLAVLSPLVVLLRTARRGPQNRGWQAAGVGVLLVTAVAWAIAPAFAGYIGGVVWLLFLFLPAVGLRKEGELVVAERYAFARRIVSLLRWLHPTAALRAEFLFLCAMEAAQAGESDRALRLLDQLRGADSRAGLQVIAQSFRIRGDWLGLIDWCREFVPPMSLGREPVVLPLYLRALGEMGAIDELAMQVAGRAPRLLASPQHEATFDASVLALLAFTGRTAAVTRLLQTRFPGLTRDVREFWLGTSEVAAGVGRARLLALEKKTQNALVKADLAARRRVGDGLPAPLSSATQDIVARFEKSLAQRRPSVLSASSGPVTFAVGGLVVVNLVIFLLEVRMGGATNSVVLYRLGALVPSAVLVGGEYWRMFSALFLHYGPLHLAVNLYALYVLGPTLERALGWWRFLISYFLGGLGSSAGVVVLWKLRLTEADLLVGASGAIMGIVGAWAGLLLRHHRVPLARRRLLIIGAIVIVQTAFDFYTPQVSMAAHLCGLLAGLAVGLILVPPEDPAPSPSPSYS